MTRLSLTEDLRRLRIEERRDTTENAFRAFVALSDVDRARMVEAFNAGPARLQPAEATHEPEGLLADTIRQHVDAQREGGMAYAVVPVHDIEGF